MTTEAAYDLIAIDRLHESKLNTRKHFDPEKLKELTASVKSHGILTPILVRPNSDGFEVAAGHRRLRAAKLAGVAEIPAIVRPMTDAQFLEILTVENLQREDLHPLEEADGYRALMTKAGYDVPSIAAKIGKSVAYVYARLKLVDLSDVARKVFLSGHVTAGHAILLARLQPIDQAKAIKFTLHQAYVEADGRGVAAEDRAVKNATRSVRELATWINLNVHLDLSKAPFPAEDAALVEKAGPCTACPKRTGTNPELFPDVKKGDTCTDPGCFNAKVDAHVQRQLEEFEVGGKPVQITTQYYAAPPVLSHDRWRSAKETDKCDGLRAGIDVDKKIVIPVCVDEKCKVHRPKEHRARSADNSSYAREQRKRQERATAETKIRKVILKAILEKVGEGLPLEVRRLVAQGFFADVWHEARKDLVQVLGWTDEKTKNPNDVVDKKLPSASGTELARALVGLAVAKNLHAHQYGSTSPATLLAMAKAYKVDAGKIRRDLDAAARKARAATKRNQAAKKKAVTKVRAKSKGKKK